MPVLWGSDREAVWLETNTGRRERRNEASGRGRRRECRLFGSLALGYRRLAGRENVTRWGRDAVQVFPGRGAFHRNHWGSALGSSDTWAALPVPPGALGCEEAGHSGGHGARSPAHAAGSAVRPLRT